MGFLGIKKRIRTELLIVLVVFSLLIIRIGYLQLIKGKMYAQMALEQLLQKEEQYMIGMAKY